MEDYLGLYINLDSRPDRRAGMEEELRRFRLSHRYKRFAASDGAGFGGANSPLSKSQIGCFASHAGVLEENLSQTAPLHIVEDDALFGPCTEQTLQMALQRNWLKDFDLLFTSTFIPAHKDSLKSYETLYQQALQRDASGNVVGVTFGVADLRHKAFASAVSYLVNPGAIQKLRALYAEEAARGPTTPIDLFIRDRCNEGRINAGLIFPFVTATRTDHSLASSIGENPNSMYAVTDEILRHSFFIGCDWDKCRALAQQAFPLPPTHKDPHKEILARVLAYNAAKDFLE